eukprot:scaffold124289_cov36-Prasinocladus_malaysianus.AAC.2
MAEEKAAMLASEAELIAKETKKIASDSMNSTSNTDAAAIEDRDDSLKTSLMAALNRSKQALSDMAGAVTSLPASAEQLVKDAVGVPKVASPDEQSDKSKSNKDDLEVRALQFRHLSQRLGTSISFRSM